MFREIRTKEKITDKFESKPGYLNIKPEKELSTKELMSWVLEELEKARIEALENN